jgi:hypothetical protein
MRSRGAGPTGLARRLWLALELYETGHELMRQNLARSHRGANRRQLDRLVLAWLLDRPGARHGDGEGVVGRWPRPER